MLQLTENRGWGCRGFFTLHPGELFGGNRMRAWNVVPGGGIEPSTHGFSVRLEQTAN
jgi:hypothetical protein